MASRKQNRHDVRKSNTALDTTFRISVGLKGADGLLELVGGMLLLVVKPDSLVGLARFLTQHELSQDPHDLIATSVLRAAENLTVSATLFGAIYLLSHGLVKVVLVYAVLKNKLWAYPWMIGFLLAFIGYQVYRLALSFSWGLVVLTAFDGFVVWLTWTEYRKRRSTRGTNG